MMQSQPTATRDAAWHEYQYNPRLSVANAATVIPGWRQRASATRERMPPEADIKYGPHPRENVDVFRSPNPKGTVVYVHGGYWRMLSKLETSWIADGFVQQGYTVVLVNYPLCPDVPLARIRNSVQHGFAYVWKNLLSEAERKRMAVVGHSAGGHLAALHLATDWRTFGLPQHPITAVLPVSGVFDVAPLIPTSMNADLRLTPETAAPLNLLAAPLLSRAKLLFAVGALEPEEFHRQSHDLARHWQALQPQVLSLEGANHYTAIDSLAQPGGQLNAALLKLLSA